jgi:phosphoglycolate phosphatase-like HAD superfamily hydrolase
MPVRTVYIDVDGTLIDIDNKIYKGVEKVLKRFKNLGYTLICWSHGGREHAKDICQRHNIDSFFTHFLDKPDILVDDTPMRILDAAKIFIADEVFWEDFTLDSFNTAKKEEK